MFEQRIHTSATHLVRVIVVCLLSFSCMITALVPEHHGQDFYVNMELDGETDESEDSIEEFKILPSDDDSSLGYLGHADIIYPFDHLKIEMVHIELHLPPPERIG